MTTTSEPNLGDAVILLGLLVDRAPDDATRAVLLEAWTLVAVLGGLAEISLCEGPYDAAMRHLLPRQKNGAFHRNEPRGPAEPRGRDALQWPSGRDREEE